jgi:hypothetical protein
MPLLWHKRACRLKNREKDIGRLISSETQTTIRNGGNPDRACGQTVDVLSDPSEIRNASYTWTGRQMHY